MIAIKKVLEKIENAGFDDMGPVVEADRGRWIIGDDAAFPVQLERLVESDSYLLYSTAIRQTGAPVQSPLLKTMMLENLCGLNLGRYGICAGPVTLTLYQRITISTPSSAEGLAAMITCHRMLMDCYIEGAFDAEDDQHLDLNHLETPMVIPFCH